MCNLNLGKLISAQVPRPWAGDVVTWHHPLHLGAWGESLLWAGGGLGSCPESSPPCVRRWALPFCFSKGADLLEMYKQWKNAPWCVLWGFGKLLSTAEFGGFVILCTQTVSLISNLPKIQAEPSCAVSAQVSWISWPGSCTPFQSSAWLLPCWQRILGCASLWTWQIIPGKRCLPLLSQLGPQPEGFFI